MTSNFNSDSFKRQFAQKTFFLETRKLHPLRMSRPISNEDLQFILRHAESALCSLREERILMTGATGFFGKWMTQTLLAAEKKWQLKNTISILTRDREKALANSPWLKSQPNIDWIQADIRSVATDRTFTTILHAAAAASQHLNENSPNVMFDTIVDGTRNVLRIAANGDCRRFLFVSSGAVYGPQPGIISHMPEDHPGGPHPLAAQSAYGEGKRAAEFLCASHARASGFELKIARCYAFLGAYLPLDTHFAAGNFISNVIHRKTIEIGGDGTPLRSYLYAADLAVWLYTILVKGKSLTAYNVGSDEVVSVEDLALKINEVGLSLNVEGASPPIRIAKVPAPGQPRHVYVPSIERAKNELGLKVWTKLPEAIEKTLKWHLQ